MRHPAQVVVVDDASTDGTWEWLQAQPGVVAVRGPGMGQAWAMNEGLPHVQGDYVRYVDSDDYLIPAEADAQFDLALATQADFIAAGSRDEEADGHLRAIVPWVPTDDLIARFLGEGAIPHYSAFLYRREHVAGIFFRTPTPANDYPVLMDRGYMLETAMRHPLVAVHPGIVGVQIHHQRARLMEKQGIRRTATWLQMSLLFRRVVEQLRARGELTTRRKRAAFHSTLWPMAHRMAEHYLEDACELAEYLERIGPEIPPPWPGVLNDMIRTLGFRRTERICRLRRYLKLGRP